MIISIINIKVIVIIIIYDLRKHLILVVSLKEIS